MCFPSLSLAFRRQWQTCDRCLMVYGRVYHLAFSEIQSAKPSLEQKHVVLQNSFESHTKCSSCHSEGKQNGRKLQHGNLFKKKRFLFCFFCLFVFKSVFCLHVCMCPWSPEEGYGVPGIGVTNSCEPLCRY